MFALLIKGERFAALYGPSPRPATAHALCAVCRTRLQRKCSRNLQKSPFRGFRTRLWCCFFRPLSFTRHPFNSSIQTTTQAAAQGSWTFFLLKQFCSLFPAGVASMNLFPSSFAVCVQSPLQWRLTRSPVSRPHLSQLYRPTPAGKITCVLFLIHYTRATTPSFL